MLKELKEKNTITVWGDGERSSCFIDIDNVVNVIRKLIYVSAKGVFNLGEKNITYKELAEMLIAQFGNSSSKIICQKEGLRSKVVIDFSRITTLLS
jgi:nucleoside-diphosphate-sugar epimerase